MLLPILILAPVHVFTVVGLLIAGYILLVVPALDRPHCLVPARFTHLGMVGGHAVGGFLWLLTCGAVGACYSGLVVGGVGGFVVGQVARAALLRKGEV